MPDQNHNLSQSKRQTVTSPEREAAVARFWNKYIAIIHDKGIKEPFDRWFVIRARHYIEAFPDKRLALHTSDDLNGYLNVLGRNSSWQGWQFRHAADTLESLAHPGLLWIQNIPLPKNADLQNLAFDQSTSLQCGFRSFL